MDAQLGRLVELRSFGGLSVEETARIFCVSEPTVSRGRLVAQGVQVTFKPSLRFVAPLVQKVVGSRYQVW